MGHPKEDDASLRRRSTQTQRSLDAVLAGEAMSMPLPTLVEATHVDAMLRQAQPRFAEKGIWTISATKSTGLSSDGLARLNEVLSIFRNAGGETIILWCPHTSFSKIFLRAATIAGLKIEITRNRDELKTASDRARKARDTALRDSND